MMVVVNMMDGGGSRCYGGCYGGVLMAVIKGGDNDNGYRGGERERERERVDVGEKRRSAHFVRGTVKNSRGGCSSYCRRVCRGCKERETLPRQPPPQRSIYSQSIYIKRFFTDDAHSLPELAITSPQCLLQWYRKGCSVASPGLAADQLKRCSYILKKVNRTMEYQLKKASSSSGLVGIEPC